MWLRLDGKFYNLNQYKIVGYVDSLYEHEGGLQLDMQYPIPMSKKRANYVLDEIAHGLQHGFRMIKIRKGEGE